MNNTISLKRRLALLAFAAAAACAAMAPARAAATVEIRHASGSTAVPASPKKVIVFDLAALDILATLGVDVAGVPSSRLPPHLARFADKKYLRAGTLFEPDFEAIHAAAPDLIIVAGRSQSKYQELSQLAPTIDLSPGRGGTLDGLEHNTRLLARLFGKEAQAEAALARLRGSIAALKAQAAKAGPGLVLLTSGGKISAHGPGSRFGVMYDTYGIQPAAANLATARHGQPVSHEFIRKTDPEWLFVVDRDGAIGRQGASAQRLLDNELVRQTRAWKKGQVVYLDGVNWYLLGGAGLSGMQQNVDQLARALSGKR